MAYAAAADVAALTARELSPEETALVERRLEQVERMIRRRVPDLETQIAAGAIAVEDVEQIEADAVLRVLRNPDGLYSETDGTYSYTFDRSAASGKLEVLPSEWELLGVRTNKMFGIAPAIPPRYSVNDNLGVPS